MSRDWNAVAKLALGTVLVLAVVTFPLPGRDVENAPLDPGDSVLLKTDYSDRAWKIIAVNGPRDTVLLRRDHEQALVAIWECTPAE